MNSFDKNLINRVVNAERERIRYEHQLRELESGRVFRTIQLLKRIKANPKKALVYIKTAPGLLKKVESLPLPEKMPTEQDIIDSLDSSSVLPPLSANAPDFRYPNIKIAVIGSTAYFAGLCHIFKVEDRAWEYFIERGGMEALLIDTSDEYDRVIAEKAINVFTQENLPIIYFVRTPDDLKHGLLDSCTHIVYDDLSLTESVNNTNKPSLYIAPSVDIRRFNPINWSRRAASKNLLAYSPELSTSDIKSAAGISLDPDNFETPRDYVQTALDLIAAGAPLAMPETKDIKALLDKYPYGLDSNTFTEDMSDIYRREKHSLYWRRHVIEHHSRLNRFEEVLEFLGLPVRPQPKVSIIHSTSRPDFLEHAMKNIERQAYSRLEAIVILHGDSFDDALVDKVIKNMKVPVQIIKRPADSLFGDNLNLAVEAADGELVAKFDDDDWYGPSHVNDLVVAWRYSEADIVGKWGNIVYVSGLDKTVDFVTKREERYGNHLPGGTILATRNLLLQNRFGHIRRGIDSELYKRLQPRGLTLYSTHRYNFIRVRHNDHTYKIEDEAWIADADGSPREGLDTESAFV